MKKTFDADTKKIATIIRFRDGDTCECHVRCGHCGSLHAEVIRLRGIESWEPNGEHRAKALATASALTSSFAGKSGPIIGRALHRDKYGRLIGDIAIGDRLLTQLLVELGYSWFGVGNHSEDHRILPVPTIN